MNRFSKTLAVTLSLTALLSANAVFAKEKPPETTVEGLELVHDSDWGLVYVEPDADFSVYEQVQLLDTYVAFKKNWRRNQERYATTRVTNSDMEKIKTRLATEFNTVFKEVLEADNGYPVVDAAGPNVLLLRPAIINLDPSSPDIPSAGRNRTYTESAGEMTIYLEIYDSETGDLIAKGMDRQADRNRGYYSWANSVQNTQAARTILRGWASSLREGLDKAHEEAPKKSSD